MKSSEFIDKPSETTTTEIMTIGNNDGISSIATKLGIRLEGLKNIEKDLGTLRQGDKFGLIRYSDGTGVLIKNRDEVSVGEKKLYKEYTLSKESIYQNIEKGSESFPFISFERIPKSNEYRLVDKKGNLTTPRLAVSSANLDALKQEIAKVSGAFVTECSSRNGLSQLSCEIKDNNSPIKSIELNSKNWYDLFSTKVSLEGIQKLLITKPDPIVIAGALATAMQK